MIVTARTDYTAAGRSPAAARIPKQAGQLSSRVALATLFFPGVMYVNRLELGIFPATGPLRQHTTYLGWLWSGFRNHRRPLHLGFGHHRFSRRLTVRHFSARYPIASSRALAPAMSNCFANVPLIVQFFTGTWWCRSSCRKISACGLNRSWTQTFNSLSPPCCAWGCLPPLRVCERYAPPSSPLPRGQKNAGLAMGLTLPQTYPLRVLLPNALPRYRAADDLGG